MYHVDLSGWYFFVCQMKIVLHELIKQRSSDVTGRHYRLADAEISLGSLQFEETVEIQAGFSSTIRWTIQSIYLSKFLFIYLLYWFLYLLQMRNMYHFINSTSYLFEPPFSRFPPQINTQSCTLNQVSIWKPSSQVWVVSWFSHKLWINSLDFFIEIYIKQMN